MALSGVIKSNSYIDGIYLQFSWSGSQSISNNYTDINWDIKFINTSSGVSFYWCRKFSATVDGETKTALDDVYLGNGDVCLSGSKRVYHNTDGLKTLDITFEGAIYTFAVNCRGNSSYSLNQIPRWASLTSAPNFKDEENPTIYYSNPAGNSIEKLQACISWTGYADIEYRDVSKTGSYYTFNLTDSERKKIRIACKDKDSITITYYLYSVIGGKGKSSTIVRTFSIINSEPVISNYGAKDINNITVSLTGNNQVLVRGYSNVQAYMTCYGAKEAEIITKRVKIGDGWYNYDTVGVEHYIKNNNFTYYVKDSRGKEKYVYKTLPIIDYFSPNCNLTYTTEMVGSQTAVIHILLSGTFFNSSFGKVNNRCQVRFRYNSGSGWVNWTNDLPVTKKGNHYEATYNINNVNYKKTYKIQGFVQDELNSIYTNEISIQAKPVFDWGNNDFKFNVTAYDNNGELLGFQRDNKYNECFYRVDNGEKLWLNPPMENNVEYRTLKYYNGKPVYVQKLTYNPGKIDRDMTFSIPIQTKLNNIYPIIVQGRCSAIYPFPSFRVGRQFTTPAYIENKKVTIEVTEARWGNPLFEIYLEYTGEC